MNGIDQLKLSDTEYRKVETSIINYQRYCHLIVRVVSVTDERVVIQAEQDDCPAGRFLTREEIEERVKEIFSDVLKPNQSLILNHITTKSI